ncbi:MAG: 2-dehydropantoate 2-reductase [uncultured Solirubrobacteraceae bacterium]|uniref:2-dehydropantoate 2-reductase n=1 Tax=uncultured Solirubrobacteraceae bacterium TaxID=1162706 RepID=A0A6J4TKZ0_9ACTN|nr:MAG: 2-dehydropantoate 2-reductase [uncultured Solirubrobacteraceae bacterium]
MSVAVLGPGGVGGFLAGALARAGEDVVVVAREETAGRIAHDGLRIESARLGSFTARPRTATELDHEVDVLIVATKAPALDDALARVKVQPAMLVPLLNGFEHLPHLRAVFPGTIAGSIRIAAERVAPGHVVQTSAFLRVELAGRGADRLAHVLRAAEIPTKVLDSDAAVLWGKLVRLCALALSTSAAGAPIGPVLTHPRRRLLLEGAVDEATAIAHEEGARVDAGTVLEELASLDPAQTSSLARDLAAGNPSELDAIGGAVMRAGARHGIATPSIDALVAEIGRRYPPR